MLSEMQLRRDANAIALMVSLFATEDVILTFMAMITTTVEVATGSVQHSTTFSVRAGAASVLRIHRMIVTTAATAAGSVHTRHIARRVAAYATMISAETSAWTFNLTRGTAGLAVMSVRLDIALRERAMSLQHKLLELLFATLLMQSRMADSV